MFEWLAHDIILAKVDTIDAKIRMSNLLGGAFGAMLQRFLNIDLNQKTRFRDSKTLCLGNVSQFE